MTLLSSSRIVAVVPALNEERTIFSVVRRLKDFVSEVVVVDDGSHDRTASEAEKAGAIVLRYTRAEGYDRSIDDGFKEARKHNPHAVVTCDADGEHDASDVADLVEPICDNRADIVVGKRSRVPHGAEKLFGFYTSLRFGITDPLCGMKAYRMGVYEAIGHFDSIQSIGTELMVRGIRKGFRAVTVPISFHPRKNDTSRFYSNKLRANLKVLAALFRVMVML